MVATAENWVYVPKYSCHATNDNLIYSAGTYVQLQSSLLLRKNFAKSLDPANYEPQVLYTRKPQPASSCQRAPPVET